MNETDQSQDGYWSGADDAVDAYHESLAIDAAQGAPVGCDQGPAAKPPPTIPGSRPDVRRDEGPF